MVQTSSIIAPPPSSQRRTSNASGTVTDGPDLISFTSPPSGEDKLMDFSQQLNL